MYLYIRLPRPIPMPLPHPDAGNVFSQTSAWTYVAQAQDLRCLETNLTENKHFMDSTLIRG